MNSYADISLRFENCSFHSEKFHWGCIVDYFEYATYDQLFNSFPCDGFVLTEKAGGPSAKSYKTYNLMVMKNGERKPEYYGLTPLWQEAVSALVGDHNIAGLEKLTGKSLGGTLAEVRFVIYSEGCWIGPHLDRPDKRLTQIVYLQHPQDRLVGGDLLILGSDKMDDVVRSVPPRPNMSVVLLPSSQSWHAVSMLESASNAPRRCVLVHFSEVNDER